MPKSLYAMRRKKRDNIPARVVKVPARMGDGHGNLRGLRTGWVWVEYSGGLVEAFCESVMPQYGAACWIAQDSDRPGASWQVVGMRGTNPAGVLDQSPNGFTEISRALRLFAKGGGQAPLWVEGKQVLPGLVTPHDSLTVNVYKNVVRTGTGWSYVASQPVDLSAHLPASAGKAVLVLLTINTSGTIVQTAGAEFTLASMTSETLMLANMPAIPSGTAAVLGAVRLYNTQTEISDGRANYTDIIDLRFAGVASGLAVALALDDLSDVTITAAAAGDLLRYNGSAWVDVAQGTVLAEAINAAAANTIVSADKLPFWDASTGGLSAITYNDLLTLYNAIYARGAGTLTVSSTNDITGASHTHAITSSASVTGAGATLLATDASGFLRLLNLGVGIGAASTSSIISFLQDSAAASISGYSFTVRKASGATTGSAQGVSGSAQVIAGASTAAASLVYGGSFGVTFTGSGGNAASASLTAGVNINAPTLTAPISISSSRLYGLNIANQGNALLTTTRAINIADQSGSSATNYAIQSGTGIVTHGDQLNVNGSQDVQQLIVTGFSTQTNPVAKILDNTAATNTVRDGLQIETQSTGTAAAGLGAGLLYKLETATNATIRSAARIAAVIVEAANATFKAKLQLSAFDTAERVGMEIAADGSLPTVNILGSTVGNEAGDTTTDLRWETDTEANALLVDASADKVYIGGTTNGLEISKGGTFKALGTATWFDDVRVEPTVRGSGSKVPTYTAWTPAGGSASGLYFYLFDNAIAANEKEVNFKLQMPHGKLLGSVIHLHVHWLPTSTGSAGQKVRWGLEYTKANPNAVFAAPGAFIYATDPVNPPSTTPTQDTHYITEFADIDMTGDALSTILLCRLFRNSSDAADTFAGDVGLLYIDCHVEFQQWGSNDEYTQ